MRLPTLPLARSPARVPGTPPRAARAALIGVALLGAGPFAASLPARAQVASQIVPNSFAPPVRGGLGGGLDVGAAPGLDTPPGADRLFVRLRGVTVDGGLPSLAGDAAAVNARLAGRRVSGAEIFAAARDLEAAYARAGYVLVRVTLPRQRIVDGSDLRLVVVDGYVERVETRALPDPVRARVDAVVASLVGVRGLRKDELERRILLAGDTPGVILRSTLAPGTGVGATVLVIEAAYQPVNGLFTADNTLSRALGRYQLGGGADFNSVFGFGELVYLRANGDPGIDPNGFFSGDPRNRTLAAGIIAPLGTDGLTFNLEGTLARTTPDADGFLQGTDRFQRLSARLRHPWIRARDVNLASQLIFDVQDERDSLLLDPGRVPLFEDRLRILRLTNEADLLAPWGGTFSGTLTPSVGLDVLGARTAGEATPVLPLSTQGSDAAFVKLDGTLAYAQPLAEHLTTSATLRGQTSFGQPLARSEQIGLGGPGSLSAFDVGTLLGDSGLVARVEFGAPSVVPLDALPFDASGVAVLLAPYLFGAGGEVFLERPTALERGAIRAASYGVGVRLGGGQADSVSNGSLTLEVSRQARDDAVRDGTRFTLVSAMRF